jgi:pectate lyase
MKAKSIFVLICLLFAASTCLAATAHIEENDAATISYDGSLKSYSAADNGKAINLSNKAKKRIVWSFDAPSAGIYTLKWRYTRKASMASTAGIYINSAYTQQITLPQTESAKFATFFMETGLKAGVNQIVLETVKAGESADIDWIEIAGTEEEDDGGDEDDGDEAADVDFSQIGYATQNGGTTGGSDGTTVSASTGNQILGYISEKKNGNYPNGLTIVVNGTITATNTSATKIDVKDCRDVSIIGNGAGAEFAGIGIKLSKTGNIILRNLKIHHVAIGDKDCIGIEGPADHIWVDHCEIYNEYSDDVDKDYYDGLLDAKADAQCITYSWNHLHDSWKTMLVGSSDSDDHDRKITMHHNILEHNNSRMPLYRFGQGHVFNNYFVDGQSTAINSRMGACLRIEYNYFENVQNPYVTAYSDEDGYGQLIGNSLVNCAFDYSSDVRELRPCSLSVPYDYAGVLNDASSVPAITRQYAGVGKLSDPVHFTIQ